MIDNQDKQTQPLDLEPAPKRRGRPTKEKALSNAERQRLYRERQKAQRNEKQESHKVPYEEVVAIAQELGERCKSLEVRLKAEFELGEKARDKAYKLGMRVAQLEHELEQAKKAQRNESPSRLNEGMRKIIQDVHEIADATQGSTWRIQRKARVNGNWVTLKGSYWNEAQAEDALAALPNKKGGWWRIIEVKSEVED